MPAGRGRAAAQQQGKAPKQYDVAAYVYPAYASDDPRLRPFWPMGIGEWETVMTMQQRNPGHYWDRKPLWGYVNEADPAVMSMEIEQATRHGVNVFIFDWYWYDGRPFMETTLDNGVPEGRQRGQNAVLPHVGQPRRTQPLGTRWRAYTSRM